MTAVSLREMPAAMFLCQVSPELDTWLGENGYILTPRTRPFVDGRWCISIRLVWRAADSPSMVLNFRLRAGAPDRLLDALVDAMTPQGCGVA